MKKILSVALLIAMIATLAIVANAGSGGQKYAKGDVALVAPDSIKIDGDKDAAYADGAYIVANCDKGNGAGNVNNSVAKTWVLWDGTSLLFFSEVKDSTPLEVSLAVYMTQPWDVDCVEYFIVWDNSDCPTTVEFDPDSSPDLCQYRGAYTAGQHGGYFNGLYGAEGFADGAEGGSPFSNDPAQLRAGFVKPTANGFNVECQINLATSNKNGAGNFTYGQGSKIAICVHHFDFWAGNAADYDHMAILYSDPTGDTKGEAVMKSAWQPADYWYVELQGEAAVTEAPAADTEAPADDTEAPVTQAPVTEDPAVTLANAKTAAIAELDALVAGKTYSAFNQKTVDSTLATAKEAINEAADLNGVASVLADAKAIIANIAATTPDTDAPTTDAPVTQKPVAPKTSDVAVAGIAVLATLALAGVVVAKKVK